MLDPHPATIAQFSPIAHPEKPKPILALAAIIVSRKI
jgi:hypothetical protein